MMMLLTQTILDESILSKFFEINVIIFNVVQNDMETMEGDSKIV